MLEIVKGDHQADGNGGGEALCYFFFVLQVFDAQSPGFFGLT